jgi:hypothetical protein
MSRIFFTVSDDNPDNEPVVVCSIHGGITRAVVDEGVLTHVMTIEGARTRMLDFQSAIEDASRMREAKEHPEHRRR